MSVFSSVPKRNARDSRWEREKGGIPRQKGEILWHRLSRHALENPFNSAGLRSRARGSGGTRERERKGERNGRWHFAARKWNMHVRLPATLLHEPPASAAVAAFAACTRRKPRASAYTHTACTAARTRESTAVMHCLGRLMHRAAQFVRVNNDRLQ